MDLSSQILQYVFTGIAIGSIYALVALGFNIIFNATEIINFAQGEFLVVGALCMITLHNVFHVPMLLAFPLAVVGGTLVGVALERLAINPLKEASMISMIIVTIGASIFIKGVAMLIWGKDSFALPPFYGEEPIRVFGATILPQTLWILGLTALVLVCLNLFFQRTILGKAIRACSADRAAARLVGIEVPVMVFFSFVLSAALGAVAGVLVAPISLMEYDRGTLLALKGFGAAVLGGLGSMTGAIIAGFLLGLLESLGAGLLHSGYKDAIALVVLLLVLYLRPGGLFGSAGEERA